MKSIEQLYDMLLARPTFREDLFRWLSFQAFLDVPGWRRWDTGDEGYDFPHPLVPVGKEDDDEYEEPPSLILERDNCGHWDWRIFDKGWRVEGNTGYKLAGLAAEEGLAAYRRLYPTVENLPDAPCAAR